ncbi:MAG: response regulator [Planctomycetes bacterium]|nr:response regulator [Planctomycetota bacterium]
MMTSELGIWIVDDNLAVRSSLGMNLRIDGYEVREFDSGEAMLRAFDPDAIGCVILDLCMPGMSGLDVLRHERRIAACVPVIMLTGYGDVASAVQAVKAGAVDMLEKPVDLEDLRRHVTKAVSNANSRRQLLNDAAEIRRRIDSLTARERELLDEVVMGKSNKQIAYGWSISLRTIENHRARMMRKMQARNAADLVRMASLVGLTEPSVLSMADQMI